MKLFLWLLLLVSMNPLYALGFEPGWPEDARVQMQERHHAGLTAAEYRAALYGSRYAQCDEHHRCGADRTQTGSRIVEPDFEKESLKV